jgi:2,4-dienoyl-CoA reductase-like NADH-dependent reductase (Old Yellow Enzyme family)
VNQAKPTEIDLTETFAFVKLLGELGVKILNTTAGSPYYNPHLQRPAAYPPSDGYQPAHDPLIDVARQVRVVREVRAQAPAGMIVVSSGLSYVQEYLPHLAQHILRTGGSDAIGVGRAVLSYPAMLADAAKNGAMETKFICRTFSDCTTAPRNGLISGCYPLDKYYTAKPDFQQLKDIKKSVGA